MKNVADSDNILQYSLPLLAKRYFMDSTIILMLQKLISFNPYQNLMLYFLEKLGLTQTPSIETCYANKIQYKNKTKKTTKKPKPNSETYCKKW